MNFVPGHGTSFEGWPKVYAYGPHCPAKLVARFYKAYEASAEHSGDTVYPYYRFWDMLDDGHVICLVLMFDNRAIVAWGLELMQDADGPYVSVLFLYGNDWFDALPAFVAGNFAACKLHFRDMGFTGEGRMLVRGRKGWRRLIERAGVRIDDAGWIREFQPAFGGGTSAAGG